jgi:hypothetical protein
LVGRYQRDRPSAEPAGRHQGKVYIILLICNLFALILGLLPLIQFPAANAAIATQMQAVLGENYLAAVPQPIAPSYALNRLSSQMRSEEFPSERLGSIGLLYLPTLTEFHCN